VRRFGLAVVVALLTFSASGVSTLIRAEPCSAFEQTQDEDASCPPTCVTCGCCAQAVEPAALNVADLPDVPPIETRALVPSLPRTVARDILHIPKPRVA
jgi:hypothetical protein